VRESIPGADLKVVAFDAGGCEQILFQDELFGALRDNVTDLLAHHVVLGQKVEKLRLVYDDQFGICGCGSRCRSFPWLRTAISPKNSPPPRCPTSTRLENSNRNIETIPFSMK
jgi:hypothetical protein